MKKLYDTIIIGGGAAGLFAGAAMKQTTNGKKLSDGNAGADTIILEATKNLGTKLLMSGSGQCNITHGGSIKVFPRAYGLPGGKFRRCLYKFSNDNLREFLHELNVPTFCREDGKVFPVSLDAHDILNALLSRCEKNNVDIKTESKVTAISQEDSIYTISTGSEQFQSRNVIIATGGCSYPTTGSDGSIFPILQRDLDIPIVTPKPALAPIKVENYPFSELAGMSFPNVTTFVTEPTGKIISYIEGGLLLTHSEFSGPSILDISKYAVSGGKLMINYIGTTTDLCRNQLIIALACSKASKVNIIAETFKVPKRFASKVFEMCGDNVTEIARALTRATYLISGTSGFDKAMVTAGGVDLSAIDTKTMEAKELPGLYIIGEALDIDGKTGGYNLQFAYSTARAAVQNIKDK